MKLTLRDLLAAAGIVVAASVCVRLGFWQLDRLAQRRAANAVIEARSALSTIEVRGQMDSDSIAYRRVKMSGTFDFSRQVIEVGRSVRGVPAVYVVTPLRLPGGAAVLVERTWAPSADARSLDLEHTLEPAESVVEGMVMGNRVAEGSNADFPLYVRQADPAALRDRYPYPVLPILVRRTALPEAADGVRLPLVPPPALSEGSHLSYAIQWFLFATIAVVGGLAAVTRRRQRKGAPVAIDIQPPEPQSRS